MSDEQLRKGQTARDLGSRAQGSCSLCAQRRPSGEGHIGCSLCARREYDMQARKRCTYTGMSGNMVCTVWTIPSVTFFGRKPSAACRARSSGVSLPMHTLRREYRNEICERAQRTGSCPAEDNHNNSHGDEHIHDIRHGTQNKLREGEGMSERDRARPSRSRECATRSFLLSLLQLGISFTNLA
jgi:hypothetical protein